MAKKWVRQPEKVSIDEAMVKYFGPHPLKQFLKGKPTRFGYKVRLVILYLYVLYYKNDKIIGT
jgi:hypothetical protein